MSDHRKDERAPRAPESDAELLSSSPFEGDLDEELAAQPARSVKPGAAVYLGAAVLVVAGFIGGIWADKQWSDGGSGSGQRAGGAPGGPSGYGGLGQRGEGGGFPGGGEGFPGGGQGFPGGGQGFPGGGQAAGGGQGGGATVGTVTKVGKGVLYIKTADGKTVKVSTSGKTTIRVTRNGTLKDLGSGTTVIVQGTAGSDGSIAATSVSQGTARGGQRP
ncbi:hypothetical protein [Actinomadura parmotrematis]|uniref:DUF5666 domain-containing protein n=1 Tax=Actinomadura parmotrematis TaxID=2864039 RepID=A0ABS7G627_9ACTN|nr:hypothetical protein [Actinomadura parmotrematis]MBW8487257.1 hypothetical protein [Actinomadura parmotrematis]